MTQSPAPSRPAERRGELSEPARRPPDAARFALALAVFAGAGSMRCLDALLPTIATEFEQTIGSVGGAASAYALSYSVFQLVHGPLGDRVGPYRVVAWATCISALAAGACALAPSLTILVALRFVAGAIASAIGPLALAWVSRAASDDDRPVALARMTAAAILGTAAGQVGGGVIGGMLGWRIVFAALAALFAASGSAMLLSARRRPKALDDRNATSEAATRSTQPLQLLRRRSVRRVLVVVGAEGFGIYLTLTYVGGLLRDRLSIGSAHAGVIVSLYGLGGVTFVVAAPWLLKRTSLRLRASGSGLLLGASFVALALSRGEITSAAALFGIGFGFLMLHNILQIMATRMAPDVLATSLSLFAAASSLSQATGAAAGGFVFDRSGPTVCCLISAATLTGLGFVVSGDVSFWKPKSTGISL